MARQSTTRRVVEYVAMTTTNPLYGWKVLARGTDPAQVERDAESNIDGHSSGIYAETEHKNLIVLSVSAARRRFGRHVIGLCECDRCWTASPFYVE